MRQDLRNRMTTVEDTARRMRNVLRDNRLPGGTSMHDEAVIDLADMVAQLAQTTLEALNELSMPGE